MRTLPRRVFALLFSISTFFSSEAVTLYISQAGDGSDGLTWETAITSIGAGMTASASGDEIVVAPGTYFERVQFEGKDVVLRSTDPEDPFVVEATVIDASKTGSVVTFSGDESADCKLSGLTITRGQAFEGGGIDGNLTHATICNNIIRDNTATGFPGGGGIYQCRSRIEGNTITLNRSVSVEYGQVSNGAGLAYCDGVIQNNLITHNEAISTNAEAGLGGGLYSCTGLIQNNVIAQNSAIVEPGAVNYGFFSGGHGGGLSNCSGRIQNNLIFGNIAEASTGYFSDEGSGGGMSSCRGVILNNTVYGNEATNSGGGMADCIGLIGNCIVWNNQAGDASEFIRSSTPFNCCIQGWMDEGFNNISFDPLFAAPEVEDFRLTEGSPCRDTGYLYLFNQIHVSDLDGNCRLVGESVDMGCYEFSSSPDQDGDFLSDAEESTAGTEVDLPDSDGDGLFDGLEVLRGNTPDQPDSPTDFSVPSEIETIQEAIFLCYPGETITVEPGLYEEIVRILGRDIHLRSSDPQDASVVQQTILDGEDLRPTVSFEGAEPPNCILEGFSITNGINGGISGGGTNATLRGNRIFENRSARGGGIYECHGLIEGNEIHHNEAAWGGGIESCHGTIRGNSIHHNTASYVAIFLSDPIISNSYTSEAKSFLPKLTPPFRSGGGLANCAGIVEKNSIYSNTSLDVGGGAYRLEGTVENNLFFDNEAKSGGALYRCPGLVRNNTIYGNRAVQQVPSSFGEGGGIAYSRVNYNNILWGNTAEVGPQIFGSDDPTYSLIEGWTEGGPGNLSEDPLYVDAEAGDFRLQFGSPCIDTGAPIGPSHDFEGNPRPHDVSGLGRSGTDAFDIGAFESLAEPPPITICIPVSGIVYDASLGMSHPVAGASVEFEASGRPPDSVFYALTDEDGEFSNVRICEDEGSSLYVTVRAAGYAPYTRTVGTLLYLFNLPPLVIPLSPILSNGRSDLNGDNIVDAHDLLILLADWKKVTDTGG